MSSSILLRTPLATNLSTRSGNHAGIAVVVFLSGTTLLATLAPLNNLPTIGNDARPAISFIKFLLPGFGGPPFSNPTLPPSLKNLLTPSLPDAIKSL